MYPRGNTRNANHHLRDYYVGGKLTELDKFYGYLQLARYSKKALEYLDKCYESGENGQDELITFSLLNRGKLSGSRTFLGNLIRGTWTWQSIKSHKNKELFDYFEANKHDHVFILHPIK